ncbi:MAG TPA: ComF family protein [Pararobbsia sp.]|nr:ComF family protein [Pararobbsia sp.]
MTAGLLPSVCALCGASACESLCNGCARYLIDTTTRCRQCALPLDTALQIDPHDATFGICGRCITRRPSFDATVCVADYAEPADSLAIALKFHGQLALASLFGSALAGRLLERQVVAPDLIVPVPLSAARLASRGYNQAWEMARVFARHIGRPADAHCLTRTRDTRAQSGLRGLDRWRNMRRAFVVERPDCIRGAHIGLVDDVMTSGATLEAAARALKQAGAARVTVFVALRTPSP